MPATLIAKKISRFLTRNQLAARKHIWRRFNHHNATATFVLGAQRSGTTMLLDCLEKSMEVDVMGEASRAMVNWRIRPDSEIREIVRSSHHKVVLFKPLTDSHRARQFLDLIPDSTVIWAFRRVEDRANSAVTKFGDHNLQVLRRFANGEGLDTWQAQGLTNENLDLVRSFDYSRMKPETAAAIFWYIRNSLFFSNRLDQLDAVLPLAYEDLVQSPAAVMERVCAFIGVGYESRLTRDIHARSVGRRQSNLPEDVVELCCSLYEQLHAVQLKRQARMETLGV